MYVEVFYGVKLTVKLLGLPANVIVTSKKSSASGKTALVRGLKELKSISSSLRLRDSYTETSV